MNSLPRKFYGKFAIEQKMCSRNLPQHCPQKIWKWKNFPFHAEFSLEKNINQIVINKIHAGCHCAVRQITEDIAQRNRHNKLKKLYYPKSIYIYTRKRIFRFSFVRDLPKLRNCELCVFQNFVFGQYIQVSLPQPCKLCCLSLCEFCNLACPGLFWTLPRFNWTLLFVSLDDQGR